MEALLRQGFSFFSGNTFITVADPSFIQPRGVAVNPTTGAVYVTNQANSTVSVIYGNTVTAIADPSFDFPLAVAVNPTTGLVYVTSIFSDVVSVIS